MTQRPQEDGPEFGEEPGRGEGRNGRVSEQIEASRRDLLDVSARNPLISFRPLRAKGVRIVDEVPREVYRILVAEKRPMYFLAAPDDEPASSGDAPSEDIVDVPSELRALIGESAAQKIDDRHADNKLQTAHSPVRLDVRLRNTLRHAQSSIEEQGVNILYLALGTLVWYESEASDVARRAPLVLVPVALERGSARARFKVLWTAEEIDANLSLDSKLRGDFGLSLPELSDGDDLDVDDYFRQVEGAVSRKERWRVDRDAVHLGFFSFSKLLIYKDLAPEAWPEDERPEDHPLLRALYGGGFGGRAENGQGAVPVADDDTGPTLDDHVAPGDTHEVMDSDSSQTEAVLAVLAGRNLVIQGPPGTGKSQTIANLIAECVAQGKRVLFVAEKMAALEVVKRRLDGVHVGDACLELHSHKSSKAAVLDELKRTVRLGRPQVADAEEDRELLRTARDRLNAYARAVNSDVGRSKLTPHQLVGKLSHLGEPDAPGDSNALSFKQLAPESWSRKEFVERRELVQEMQDLVESMGRPRDHPLWGTALTLLVPSGPGMVAGALDAATEALGRHWEHARRLLGLLGAGAEAADAEPQEPALDAAATAVLLATAARVTEAPNLSGVRHRAPEWTDRAAELEALARDALEFARIRAEHDSALIPEAWDHPDVLAHRQALAACGDKWWRLLSGGYRRAAKGLRGLSREAPPKKHRARLALLDAVLAARRLHGNVERSSAMWTRLVGGGSPGWSADAHRRTGEAAQWLLRLHADTASGAVHPCVHDALDRPPDQTELNAAVDACRRSRKALSEALGAGAAALKLDDARFAPLPPPGDRPFDDLERWLASARDATGSLQDMVRFNQIAQRLADQGLECVTDAAAEWDQAGRGLVRVFERRCYLAWLESAWRERPVLAEFDGATHQGSVARFRQMDQGQFARNQARVARRHWEAVPRGVGGGQMGVLRREFEKKRRHLPLRKLMEQAGNAVQRIKPVFMMSPLSVAKFVPPKSPVRFDLAIFDEASQVRPTEAFGAIARAAQAVVVGDSKQLPPTTFFDRMAEDDDEMPSQTSDLESILGMFCAGQAPERMLKWHYRSRHESLISFSNHEFYDNRLVVFPSPDKGRESTGLHMRYDPGAHYKPGRGGRVNPGEARAVADAVMKHASESPHLTLGVAAFSLSQARAVEDQLEILRRQDGSCETFFAAHPEEPFFVKNLENVQGDERDVILISVGYGKRQDGHMPMNFGPLNQDGGERRLNVLVTRARRRCWVFANFEAADLDLRRTKARGVEALKTFLEYARTGRMELPRQTGRAADSPFEEAVARELRRRGHQVDHQVGSAGFFVDLAVVDPDRPGRYLLGVECDGASYHSARSARDRDRLRQQVLEGLGWTIHRIWSTDWFRNPGREMERLEEAIRRAVRAGPDMSCFEAADPLAAADQFEAGRPPDLGAPPDAGDMAPGGAPPSQQSPPSRPASLVREAPAAAPAPRKRSVPYAVAELEIDLGDLQFHEVPVEVVSDWLAEVVSVEGPVHWEEACVRVVRASGLKQAGSRIKKRVLEAVGRCVRDGTVVANGDFLWSPDRQWLPGQPQAVVRCRDGLPGGLRTIECIAPEEIGHALVLAVRDSHGVRDDDVGRDAALRDAARIFGFKRVGKELRAGLQDVLGRLVEDGTVERRGGFLYEAGDSSGERNP